MRKLDLQGGIGKVCEMFGYIQGKYFVFTGFFFQKVSLSSHHCAVVLSVGIALVWRIQVEHSKNPNPQNQQLPFSSFVSVSFLSQCLCSFLPLLTLHRIASYEVVSVCHLKFIFYHIL